MIDPSAGVSVVRVLVADDEAHVRDYARRNLAVPGLLIVDECGSPENLDSIDVGLEPNVVFLDVYFDGVDRLKDMVGKLDDRWPSCQIIELTGSPVGMDRRCFDRITKPELDRHPGVLRRRLVEALREKAYELPPGTIERLEAAYGESPNLPFKDSKTTIMSIRGQVEDPEYSADEVEVLLEEDEGEFRQVFIQRHLFDDHPSLLVERAGFELVTSRVSSKVVTEVRPLRLGAEEIADIDALIREIDDDLEQRQESPAGDDRPTPPVEVRR